MYRLKLSLVVLISCLSVFPSFCQTWELYNSQYQLQSRLVYQSIFLLSESVKIGKTDSSLFLLNSQYQPSVNLEGDELYQYLEPWILVKNQKGIGAFHEYGQKVLPLEFEEIETYLNLLLARKGNEYWIYDRGKDKSSFLGEFDQAKITHNGQVIAQKSGKFFLPLSPNPSQGYLQLSDNEGDYLLAQTETGFGLINMEGRTILEPIIDSLIHTRGDFYYGYDEDQYLLIEGHPIRANVRYNSFHKITYENDLMLEYIHGKLRRVMEEDGILLDAVGMTEVNRIERDIYQVRFRDQKLGLLGKQGWLVQPTDSLEGIFNGKGGLFPAQKNGLFGFVNQRGEWKIEPEYQEVSTFSESIAAFKHGGFWGLMDSRGSILSSAQWNEIKGFSQNFALASKDQKWFLLDKSGHSIFEDGFDQISRTDGGYFLFSKNGKIGLANAQGKLLLEAEYDFVQREKSDLIIVRKNEKMGVISESGDVKLPLDYEEISIDQTTQQILARGTYQPIIVVEEEPIKQKRKRGQ
ncbi:WG repeat-containing protein [Algoriphagus hitonicola]|uniref:WG containing repeat-containing protein n=1 Tax=Algoriphagus hitonicola TaxID=435880 RepID=A0A1I2TIR0_9BACT|nr:WG repeat-containing protein [Algoriphagus hitonicola]SFG64785.1 WG containing repeat-containing protein [Algoriphagus hitonicola]